MARCSHNAFLHVVCVCVCVVCVCVCDGGGDEATIYLLWLRSAAWVICNQNMYAVWHISKFSQLCYQFLTSEPNLLCFLHSYPDSSDQLCIKGIFTDSNDIFLLHESEDINETGLFPKFQLLPMLRFQVMHDLICMFHCSHRLLCWIKSRVWDFLWKLLSFHTEMISA